MTTLLRVGRRASIALVLLSNPPRTFCFYSSSVDMERLDQCTDPRTPGGPISHTVTALLRVS